MYHLIDVNHQKAAPGRHYHLPRSRSFLSRCTLAIKTAKANCIMLRDITAVWPDSTVTITIPYPVWSDTRSTSNTPSTATCVLIAHDASRQNRSVDYSSTPSQSSTTRIISSARFSPTPLTALICFSSSRRSSVWSSAATV